VVFIKPEEDQLNKQPRKAWEQAAPVGDLFGDKKFEGRVTHSISREDEDDILATGAPLIPAISEVSVIRLIYIIHYGQQQIFVKRLVYVTNKYGTSICAYIHLESLCMRR